MKNSSRLIFIGAGLLLLIAVVMLVMMNRSHFNWNETYEVDSKEPYGTWIMGEQLRNYHPEKKFVILNTSCTKSLPKENNNPASSYIFIGRQMSNDTNEINAIFSFVSKGNVAFIS